MDESPLQRDDRLLALWGRLVGLALHWGVARADAEDLASQAVLKSLESFDPARGAFGALCSTVLGNLVKNHWRDRRLRVDIDDLPGLRSGDDPRARFEEVERMEQLRILVARLSTSFDPEERRFFEALGEVLAEKDRVIVSEAARRVGLSAGKGWDLFRRIQRRAEPARGEFLDSIPAASRIEQRDENLHEERAEFREVSFCPRRSEGPPPEILFKTEEAPPRTDVMDACRMWHAFSRFAASIPADRRSALDAALPLP
jgi:DNA-directed RNA polymerase specialized sigma24 family protein